MPALPDVPGVIRIDFVHQEGGDPSLSNRTFWAYRNPPPSNADLSTLATAVHGLWVTWLSSLAVTTTELVEIVCTDLTHPTAGRGSWIGTAAGTRSGPSPPDNVCTLLNFQIARRYRGGKPRIYAPWGSQLDIATNEQEWQPAFANLVNSAWTGFAQNMNGLGFAANVLQQQQNVSYYSGVNGPNHDQPIVLPSGRVKNVANVKASTTPDPIVGHSCNLVLGSQRRRLRA